LDALRGTISISCRSSSFWHSHGKLLISPARDRLGAVISSR
jgi:hypothetical protein